MLNNILIVIILVAMVIAIAICMLTLFGADGHKKNWFLATMVMTSVFLLGHLLELISTDTEAAFMAVRVLYIGLSFVGTFAFFFVADFCEYKLSNVRVRIPLTAFSLGCVIIMWTTDTTGLLYKSYWLTTDNGHFLDFEPTMVYNVLHIYPGGLLAASIAVIVIRSRAHGARFNKTRRFLICVFMIPFIAEMLYFVCQVTGMNPYHVYFTPHSLVLMNLLLFFGIVRYDIVGLRDVATRRVLDSISEAYVLIDEGFGYVVSNPAAHILFPALRDYESEAPIDELPGWPDALRHLPYDSDNSTVEFEMKDDGILEKRWFIAEVSRIRTASANSRTAWAILLRDVTANNLLLRELEESAYRDPLTSLSNRRRFSELAVPAVSKAERSCTPYYVMMLDLDRFKHVNDTYGHLAGDEVLKTVARLIVDTVRDYDIVGRWGGEEFILLVTDAKRHDAKRLAERIRAKIESYTTHYGKKSIRMTVSIGIAESVPGCPFDAVVELADNALYHAKKARNRTYLWGDDA